ncbi:MAG: DUF3127 domain-containing protein [Muribaculaceae bacterium]|nr:DUF3127 domain-containing protein [Muribaculaceae bacterium]
MEINGKIIQKLPRQSGTSKAGNAWSKQTYILETINETYPKKVAFDFFGEDRINQFDAICEIGNLVTVSYDIESREFNGRWYTDIRGWKAVPYEAQAVPAQQSAPQPAAPAAMADPGMPTPPPPAEDAFLGGGDTDDIPF